LNPEKKDKRIKERERVKYEGGGWGEKAEGGEGTNRKDVCRIRVLPFVVIIT
jgi:hypothetical protein